MNEISPGQIIWPLMSVLSSVAVIVGMIIGFIKLNRRTPPLAEELAEKYATKTLLDARVAALNDRVDREIRIIRDGHIETSRKLDGLITTTNRTSEETQRSLGRIEGKLDAHLEQHA